MAVLLDAPLHLRATIGGFCSGRTLQALLCTSRTAAERFSEPAVLRQVAFTCHYCDAHFTGADNAPDACAYHPCDVRDFHDSQGGETVYFACCNASYSGNHYYNADWDEIKAENLRNTPPCTTGAHYPRGGKQEMPQIGAQVEVFHDGRWVPGVVQSWAAKPAWDWHYEESGEEQQCPTWDDANGTVRQAYLEREQGQTENRIDHWTQVELHAEVRVPGVKEPHLFKAWQVRWPSAAPLAFAPRPQAGAGGGGRGCSVS